MGPLVNARQRDRVLSYIEKGKSDGARLATGGSRAGSSDAEIKSVMPGVVKEVLVTAEQPVESGQALLILEAMKMQNEIRAPGAGVVESVAVAADTVVAKGDVLVTLAVGE